VPPRRDLDHRGARIRQHRVERRRELTSAIADEEPEPVDALAAVHGQQRVHGSGTPQALGARSSEGNFTSAMRYRGETGWTAGEIGSSCDEDRKTGQ
jgi:hypothetical protein